MRKDWVAERAASYPRIPAMCLSKAARMWASIKWRRIPLSLICNSGCGARGAIAEVGSALPFSTSGAAAIV